MTMGKMNGNNNSIVDNYIISTKTNSISKPGSNLLEQYDEN